MPGRMPGPGARAMLEWGQCTATPRSLVRDVDGAPIFTGSVVAPVARPVSGQPAQHLEVSRLVDERTVEVGGVGKVMAATLRVVSSPAFPLPEPETLRG